MMPWSVSHSSRGCLLFGQGLALINLAGMRAESMRPQRRLSLTYLGRIKTRDAELIDINLLLLWQAVDTRTVFRSTCKLEVGQR